MNPHGRLATEDSVLAVLQPIRLIHGPYLLASRHRDATQLRREGRRHARPRDAAFACQLARRSVMVVAFGEVWMLAVPFALV